MRTATTVFVAGSLLVFASCSSSTNDSADGGGTGARYGSGANGNSSSGANANSGGNSNSGASGNTGANVGTGGSLIGPGECAVGNPCTGNPNYCVAGNILCYCVNGQWGLCSSTGTGGTGPSNTGGTGNGLNTGGVANGANTGGTGNDGTGANGTGGAPCASLQSKAVSVPPILFFMIDSTGSMGDTPASGSTGGLSKWAVLQTVWPQVIGKMPGEWAVGLMVWACPNCPNAPYQPATAVPIGPLDTTQVAALGTALNFIPRGWTPTECAWEYALQQIQAWQAPPKYEKSPRFIVLLTDGVPTVSPDCQTLGAVQEGTRPIDDAQYDELIASVAAGLAGGIKTFVAGVPGSDEPQGAPYDPMYKLSLLASAGGTAKASCTAETGTPINTSGTMGRVEPRGTYCHYDLTQTTNFAADLQDAIGTIAREVVSCKYLIPPPPSGSVMISTTQVLVTYTSGTSSTQLGRAPSDDCAQGGQWYFSKRDANDFPTEMQLCAETCSQAQADLNASITVEFQCLGE